MVWLVALLVFIAVVTVLNLKTSRCDGEYLGKIHPYRKVMLYMMPTRNESFVLYDDYVEADEALRYLEAIKGKRFHADMQHLFVAAVSYGMRQVPSMNRFVIGRRLYQRKGVWVTFAMKRQKRNRAAKLAVVKREIPENQSLLEMAQGINENINVERSDAVTYTDKEVGLMSKIPRPLMNLGYKFLQALNYYNLLPESFIRMDGFHTSLFAANLGSIGMNAGYHHLYEWGTSPLFMMIGRLEERVFVENGEIVIKKVIPLRFTYDERIDDGLTAGHGIKAVIDAMENPFEVFGCTQEDGSDDHPIGKPPAEKAERLAERLKQQHTVVAQAT